MRGTGSGDEKDFVFYRITPACAGNRYSITSRRSPRWDHPRVCGEQSTTVSGMTTSRGSPPRVRGTVDRHHQGYRHHRITPACAGNSLGQGTALESPWDHPRVCGEQIACVSMYCFIRGSPPRVRGTGSAPFAWISITRITPACAGNSPRGRFTSSGP